MLYNVLMLAFSRPEETNDDDDAAEPREEDEEVEETETEEDERGWPLIQIIGIIGFVTTIGMLIAVGIMIDANQKKITNKVKTELLPKIQQSLADNTSTITDNQEILQADLQNSTNALQNVTKGQKNLVQKISKIKESADAIQETSDKIRKAQTENQEIIIQKLDRNWKATEKVEEYIPKYEVVQNDINNAINVNRQLLKSMEDLNEVDQKMLQLLTQSDNPSQTPQTSNSNKNLGQKIDNLLAGQKDMKENQNKILKGQKVTGEQLKKSTETILNELEKGVQETKRVLGLPSDP